MNIDRDLQAIQEVRDACCAAKAAQLQFKEFSQEQVDQIVTAMYKAGYEAAEPLARMAVEETGFGRLEDKITKNQFATKNVFDYILPLKTVGIIETGSDGAISKIAEPMGVVAGIIPSTNPTSTTLFKALIAVKSRNAIVFSPHPAALKCVAAAAHLLREAAEKAGAPAGLIHCLSYGLMNATTELMQHPDVAVILATGGAGLVKAAYSAGKPAYGVGPGNVPAFIERTADISKAVKDILVSKIFDYGTVCASEQAVIVDAPLEQAVIEEFRKHNACFLSPEESEKLAKVLVTPKLIVNPLLVGRSAAHIAQAAGFSVPENTSVLISRQSGVGENFPLTIEKLSPVLAFFVEDGWHAGCERCIEILNFGGLGHTLVIHSQDKNIIREFGLRKPAFRILVNTPGTQGAIGLTTNLEPSLTLGCGTFGGNITADNVTPLHLLNIKRLAHEVRPINPLPVSPIQMEVELAEPKTEKTQPKFPYQQVLAPWAARKVEKTEKRVSVKPVVSQTGIADSDIEEIVRDVLIELEK